MSEQEIQEPTLAEDQEMSQAPPVPEVGAETDGAAEESFPVLTGNPGEEAARGIDFILDLPLHVTVELGKTEMVVNELLQLAQGSVIELEKLAGDPLEILVNNKLIARGEVVAVNDKFGIRVTDIITPTERIEKLA